MVEDPSAPVTPPAPAAGEVRRRGSGTWRALFGTGTHLLVVLALIGGPVGGLWWLLRTEPGTAWLMAHLPRVKVEGVRGRVLGDFYARRVEVPLAGAPAGLLITDLAWRGLHVGSAKGPAWVRIAADELSAARVELRLGPGDDSAAPPLQPPDSLGLPVEVEIGALRVGELLIDKLGDEPIRSLQTHVHLSAEAGEVHRIDDLRLEWARLRVSGDARIASGGDLPLQLRLDAEQPLPASGRWHASATLSGPLATPQLQATLRAQVRPSQPAQSLDLQAGLQPFAAWPLGSVQARAKDLDLSALHPAAPATELDIEASANSSGMDQAAALSVAVVNRRPGLWNEGRLPLRQLDLHLSARPDDPSQLEVRSFEARLGTQREAAGRLIGSGRWNPAQWALELNFDALQPDRLDARAPAMLLGGRARFDASGFDSVELGAARIEARADIEGRLLELQGATGLPAGQAASDARQVQLKLDALWSPLRIEVRQALARAGAASASLAGELRRPRNGAPWTATGQATLEQFDPLPWWPGAADSPWRQGPHRLNAYAGFNLQLPATDTRASALALLRAVRGTAQVELRTSQLAGLPIDGRLDASVSAQGRVDAKLDLKAAGNTLRASAQGALLDAAAVGADDTLALQAEMPALQRLTPLWRLLRGGDADAAVAGRLSIDAQARGRWPALETSGRIDASRLHVDVLDLQKATARWTVGSRGGAPLQAQIDVEQLAWGSDEQARPSVRSLQLKLDGSVAEHRIELAADSKALPPLWVEKLQATAGAAATSTLARLRAAGGFTPAGAMPFAGWRGVVQDVDLRGDAKGAPAWLSARDIDIDALWAGDAATPARADRVAIGAGQVQVLGARLVVDRFRWRGADGAGAQTELQADARLEPLSVAPLLQRLQPGFGWGGDLQLSGHLKVQSSPTVRADVIIERAGGDLTVKDDSGLRSMGLSDLRMGLNAQDGVWNFFVGLAGKTLGTASGAVVARTTPQALWLDAQSEIQGVLDLQVADLGIWGPWLPPGWRLDGGMRANAAIGGRFGAPEYTGQITGSRIAVRNLLEGVQVRDGDFSIALQGDTARIERFNASAGEGTLELRGDASLGETPRAQLQLSLDRFGLLGRVDRRIVTSGQARLVLGKDSVALDGEVKIDEGLIDFSRSNAPTLSEDVVVFRGAAETGKAPDAKADPSAPPGVAVPTTRKVDLQLHVLLGEQLKLRGQGLDAELRGELLLTAPAGRLQVFGTVRVVNGTYRAYRQNLEIDRGILTFTGPIENPTLDIEASRPNLDVRVGVAVTGTVLVPRIRLFSDTPMSDVEKLSWLLRGRAGEGSGADTALLQAAALAVASGDEPGALDQLLNAFGVDELSLRDSDVSGGGTVVSVGKQLSRNWYLGYERSLNAATGNFQLIYRIAQRFTVRVQSGSENSISLIWTWRWQ